MSERGGDGPGTSAARARRSRREAAADLRLLPAKVAFLRSEGVSQSEIAARLGGISPSGISRMLAPGGGAHGYLTWIQPRFDWTQVADDDVDAIRAVAGENAESVALTRRAIRAYQAAVRVSVIRTEGPGGQRRPEDEPAEQRRQEQRFFSRAAEMVFALLGRPDTRVIGVTWGKTLELLFVEAASLRLASPLAGPEADVIPLVGESPAAALPTARSSSSLAQTLARLLAGPQAPGETGAPRNGERGPYSLTGCPAFLPGSFTAAEIAAIHHLMEFVPSYGRIYGSPRGSADVAEPPLANRLDVIVTGVSRAGSAFGMEGDFEVMKTMGLQVLSEALGGGVMIGDLGGVPLLDPSTPDSLRSKVMEVYETRWLGLKHHHVFSTAARARERADGPAGVIVIGRGEQRAEPLREALQGRLINELIIDQAAAAALARILPP